VKSSLIFLLFIAAISAILLFYITKKMDDQKPKVVVVLKELDTQYWKIVKAGVEKGFQDFGLNGIVIAPSSQTEEEEQEGLLKKFLIEKLDVLVVAPIESPEHQSVLKEFVNNKIPVLLVDTNIPLEGKSSYIGTDNYKLGRKAGELLASELYPGDEVALITGNLTSTVLDDRVRGAKASLEQAGIKIAAEKAVMPNESYSVKQAMEEVLKEHSNVKGVFATTDIMALHALEELEKQKKKMPVIGADGIIEMVELVDEGKLPGTVAQNPYDMGYLSAQAAMNAANGKNVDSVIDSGVDIIIKGNGNERITFLKNVLE
jgi:ribose transport system substrate-binding protein